MQERAPRESRVVYDHQDHVAAGAEPRAAAARDAVTIQEDSRGRRREIADWGGDELFGGRVARRRFTRTGARPEGHAAPPHASGAPARHPGDLPSGRFARPDERRGGPEPFEAGHETDGEAGRLRRPAPRVAGEAPTDDGEAGRLHRPAPRAAGETPTDDVAAGRFRRPAPLGAPESPAGPAPARRSQAGRGPTPVAGRRTVRIGSAPGEPDAAVPAQPARRRRPPRPVHERVGASPDRIAAWAFALGLVLILIAIVTAGGLG
jgi:hypothetical protein